MSKDYCPYCGMRIPDDASICPYCHKEVPLDDNERKVLAKWVIGICLLFAIIGIILYLVKPFHSPVYPEQKDDTLAYAVLIVSGVGIGGVILGLICSWIEKKCK